MSDINLKREQYLTLSQATDDVNNAIIALKKQYKRSQGVDNPAFVISPGELKASAGIIRQIMESLVKLGNSNSQPDYSIIPSSVADRLQKDQNDLLQQEKKYRAINRTLDSGKPLDEEQLYLLDRVVSTLNKERSILFKKLRTARG